MHDAFEQSLVAAGRMPSADVQKENPGGACKISGKKLLFRRPVYNGTPLRSMQAVPHV